jgi:hypothetical protein
MRRATSFCGHLMLARLLWIKVRLTESTTRAGSLDELGAEALSCIATVTCFGSIKWSNPCGRSYRRFALSTICGLSASAVEMVSSAPFCSFHATLKACSWWLMAMPALEPNPAFNGRVVPA